MFAGSFGLVNQTKPNESVNQSHTHIHRLVHFSFQIIKKIKTKILNQH